MKFVDGTSVYSLDDEKLGEIDRVVIGPANQEVSHLVVEKGFFFREDKVISVEAVKDADEERVILKQTKNALEVQPFEQTAYIPLHEMDNENRYPATYRHPMYAYPPVGVTAGWGTTWHDNPAMDTPSVEITQRNIPKDAIALTEGAEVYTFDREHVGNIESVITTDEANVVTHFVISRGFLFETLKLIPAFWIEKALEDKVYLGVHSDTLHELPDYEYEVI